MAVLNDADHAVWEVYYVSRSSAAGARTAPDRLIPSSPWLHFAGSTGTERPGERILGAGPRKYRSPLASTYSHDAQVPPTTTTAPQGGGHHAAAS